MSVQKALVAAGCFWGVQYYFDQVPGVVATTVGYSGGQVPNPTYDAVCTGLTGHAEAVLIEFNSAETSYETIIKQFFRMHDPTQHNRQGPDVGTQYRSAIFFFDQDQKATAIAVRNRLQEQLDQPIATDIEPAGPFYEAEPYHQKFSERTGMGMCHIPYEAVS